MPTGAKLLDELIKNSNKVQAYDLRNLNEAPGKQAGGGVVPRKLSGSLMIKRKKQQSSDKRANYTFAL